MYIALGNGKYIMSDDIVAVFDLDITSQSHLTRSYLSLSEKGGKVINASEDLPKSFVIDKYQNVYLSQMSSSTLNKRIEGI